MNFEFDKKYLKISLYVIFTVFVIRILDFIIGSIPGAYKSILSFLSSAVSILWPVIIALGIAYLLNTPTRAIEKLLNKKIKNNAICRSIAICVSYIVLIGIIISIVVGIYFMVGGQLSNNTNISNIVNYIQKYMTDANLSDINLTEQIEKLNIPFIEELAPKITIAFDWLQDFIKSLTVGIMDSIISLGSNLFTFIVSLILSIYLLFSSEYFLSLWNKAFFVIFRDKPVGISIKRGLKIINYTFTNYIKGQLIEAFFVMIMCYVVLFALDIDYAIVIAIISGLLNLVPYVGAFIGVILGGFMGLLTKGTWTAIWAVVCLIIVQQIDANILSPRVVGNKVGVHPAFIIIAITIGGSKWGLLGMLLAVPVTASFIMLVRLWYRNNFAEKYAAYKDVEDSLIFPHEVPEEEKPVKKVPFWKRAAAKARDIASGDDEEKKTKEKD